MPCIQNSAVRLSLLSDVKWLAGAGSQMAEEDLGERIKTEVLDNVLGKTHHKRQMLNPLLFILGPSQITGILRFIRGVCGSRVNVAQGWQEHHLRTENAPLHTPALFTARPCLGQCYHSICFHKPLLTTEANDMIQWVLNCLLGCLLGCLLPRPMAWLWSPGPQGKKRGDYSKSSSDLHTPPTAWPAPPSNAHKTNKIHF